MGFSKDFEEGLIFLFQNDQSDRNLRFGDSTKVGGRKGGKKRCPFALISQTKREERPPDCRIVQFRLLRKHFK